MPLKLEAAGGQRNRLPAGGCKSISWTQKEDLHTCRLLPMTDAKIRYQSQLRLAYCGAQARHQNAKRVQVKKKKEATCVRSVLAQR